MVLSDGPARGVFQRGRGRRAGDRGAEGREQQRCKRSGKRDGSDGGAADDAAGADFERRAERTFDAEGLAAKTRGRPDRRIVKRAADEEPVLRPSLAAGAGRLAGPPDTTRGRRIQVVTNRSDGLRRRRQVGTDGTISRTVRGSSQPLSSGDMTASGGTIPQEPRRSRPARWCAFPSGLPRSGSGCSICRGQLPPRRSPVHRHHPARWAPAGTTISCIRPRTHSHEDIYDREGRR